MSRLDPWEKAAECARAIDATSDPEKRKFLTHLQALWTNLANEAPFLADATLADQFTAIDRIHADVTRLAH
jgi:hypothetical protein